MIAYEELQRALARWKSRHAGAGDGSDAIPEGYAAAGVTGEVSEPPRDSTSEIDLADAEVDEA